jgi:hypothetical protein
LTNDVAPIASDEIENSSRTCTVGVCHFRIPSPRAIAAPPPGFLPFDSDVEERPQLIVEAYRNAR